MTTITLSLDSIRDWLAERAGWTLHEFEHEAEVGTKMLLCWAKSGVRLPYGVHPFPATRDGAASAMREGWNWERRLCIRNGQWAYQWIGEHEVLPLVFVYDTGDEIADRYRLAAACIIAEEKANG